MPRMKNNVKILSDQYRVPWNSAHRNIILHDLDYLLIQIIDYCCSSHITFIFNLRSTEVWNFFTCPVGKTGLSYPIIVHKCQALKICVSPWTVACQAPLSMELILQTRILKWVAIPFSRGSSPTQGSNTGLPHRRQILDQLSHQGIPRILEWVTYPFFSGSSHPRNQTGVSCIAGGLFTSWATREALMTFQGSPKMLGKYWYPVQRNELSRINWGLITIKEAFSPWESQHSYNSFTDIVSVIYCFAANYSKTFWL